MRTLKCFTHSWLWHIACFNVVFAISLIKLLNIQLRWWWVEMAGYLCDASTMINLKLWTLRNCLSSGHVTMIHVICFAISLLKVNNILSTLGDQHHRGRSEVVNEYLLDNKWCGHQFTLISWANEGLGYTGKLMLWQQNQHSNGRKTLHESIVQMKCYTQNTKRMTVGLQV